MYLFENPAYLNNLKEKFEKEFEITIPSYVWESLVSQAGENAGMCLEDENLSFEDNAELYDQYFSDTLEQTSLDNIEAIQEFYNKF